MQPPRHPAPPSERKPGWLDRVREFLYGFIGYEFAHTALAERSALESLFILVTVGDLIGVPMLQTLDTKPDLVLVREAEFVKLRPRIDVPVLWVRATVDGQFVLQAFPGYEQEAETGRDALPRRLRGRNVMEPFLRIRSALEEAHNLKVGESRKA